jgi:hypothetical protein
MGRRLVSLEQPSRAEKERPGANRGHPASLLPLRAQEVEHLFVLHQRHLSAASGDEQDVELGARGERHARQDRHFRVGGDRLERLPKEMHFRVGKRLQHFVRPR